MVRNGGTTSPHHCCSLEWEREGQPFSQILIILKCVLCALWQCYILPPNFKTKQSFFIIFAFGVHLFFPAKKKELCYSSILEIAPLQHSSQEKWHTVPKAPSVSISFVVVIFDKRSWWIVINPSWACLILFLRWDTAAAAQKSWITLTNVWRTS